MKTPLTIPYNQPSMVFVIKFLAKTLLKFISHYSQPQCVNFAFLKISTGYPYPQ